MSEPRPLLDTTVRPDFRALFESAPGLFLALLPDAPRYTIVAVSDTYARATMISREAVIGQGLFDVFPDDPDDPAATGVRNLSASLARAMASRAPDAMAVQKYDVRRPESDGGGFEERWWSPLNSPVLDAEGQVIYLIHRVEDVTEFVRLGQAGAAALSRSEEQWQALFAQASEGIFVADAEGRYTDVNRAACELLGCECADLLGKTVADLVAPHEVARLRGIAARRIEGRLRSEEWWMRRKDGSTVPVEWNAKLLSDGRWIAFARDNTKHRRMTEELERRVAQHTAQLRRLAAELEGAAIRERQQLARDLHDDLAQTLSAAAIRLAALRDAPRADLPARLDSVLALIGQADRATRSLAAQLAPAVLYELGLGAALEWLAEGIERTHGLRVSVEDDGEVRVLSQEARSILYRAVRELLINVAKHARTDLAVVETRCEGDEYVIRVSDAGIGFDSAATPRGAGSGLGLASVRERLSFIGGTAQVHSVPGDGTMVELRVPLAEAMVLEVEAGR